MSNIPTRDRPVAYTGHVQKAPQRPPMPGQRENFARTAAPNKIPQPPRVAPTVAPIRQNGVKRAPGTPSAPRAALEKLQPVKREQNPPKKTTHTKKKAKSKRERKEKHSQLGDFFLSFIVSLVLFGIAAIVVCNALISLFT